MKHAVIFTLSTSNPRVENGVTWIDCTFRFLDAESGEELAGTFLGSGSARDEKGHYAAVTGAIKYALTSTLLIPTGDDPENDENEAKAVKPAPNPVAKPAAPKQPTKEQLKQINELAYAKLAVKTDEEIVPAINKALGTDHSKMKIATDVTIAQAIIDALTNLS